MKTRTIKIGMLMAVLLSVCTAQLSCGQKSNVDNIAGERDIKFDAGTVIWFCGDAVQYDKDGQQSSWYTMFYGILQPGDSIAIDTTSMNNFFDTIYEKAKYAVSGRTFGTDAYEMIFESGKGYRFDREKMIEFDDKVEDDGSLVKLKFDDGYVVNISCVYANIAYATFPVEVCNMPNNARLTCSLYIDPIYFPCIKGISVPIAYMGCVKCDETVFYPKRP